MTLDTTTTDALRQDRNALLEAVAACGMDTAKPNAIRCSFHDDAHASAGIYERDGVWRFKCHVCGVGGDVFDMRARANGTTPEREMRRARESDGSGKPGPRAGGGSHVRTGPSRGSCGKQRQPPTASPAKTFPDLDACWAAVERSLPQTPAKRTTHRYTCPTTGRIEAAVFRADFADGTKAIRQGHQFEDGQFVLQGPAKPTPLYNRTRITQADRVLVVEGEKAVEALQAVGIVATTNLGGAGKAAHANWFPLAGKTVVLWPDRDPPNDKGERTGIAHMREVAKLLDQLDPAPRVLWFDPDLLDLPDKGDAADFIDKLADLTPEQKAQAVVSEVIGEAVPLGPSSEVAAVIRDAIAGRRVIVPWPWDALGRLSRALTPGTVTLLCASPGATKSFALIEAAGFWHEQGHTPAVLELEDGRAFHLRRALAQRAGIADLTDDDWCRNNPALAESAARDHESWLDGFGRCLHELSGDQQPTLKAIGDWIEVQAMAGKRVIAVDPLSIAEQGRDQYAADARFTARVKRIAEQTGCSLVLVMHPRKGAQTRTVDDVAGGAAYGRLAQTVLWLESWTETRTVTIRDHLSGLSIEQKANRVISLTKTRNGRGMGLRVGFHFDSSTLRLAERGVIVKRGAGDD